MSRGSQQTLRSAEYGALIEVLKEARLASGLTQKAICDKLRKPRNYVLKIERGERRLDVIEFFALCDAMGSDALELLRRYDDARR